MAVKNNKAAAACYQRAIRINPRDYRGYFSLGQVYEQEQNDSLAFFYYMRAASLQYACGVGVRSREKLPLVWLTLGRFLQSKGRDARAVDAYLHGRRSDAKLASHEARLCLLHLCQMAVRRNGAGDALTNCVTWIEQACTHRDDELRTEEGMEIVRFALKQCDAENDERGVQLCADLENVLSDSTCMDEVMMWKQCFAQKEVDRSVSMDCSDSCVCCPNR